jgi:putative tricarboxylic transport membrane protein
MPRDTVVGAVVLAIAGVYWWAAGTIRRSSLDDAIGAAGLPNTLAAVLAGLALLLILRGLILRPRPAQAAEVAASSDVPRAHLRAAGMLTLGILYLLVVPTLGYALSVALLMAGVALYNHRPPKLDLVLFAIFGAAAFYVLFVKILGIPLPPGIWPRLLPAG